MENAKKRILFIITQAEWGGAQNFVYKAAQEAKRRGYDVLVTAGGEGSLETKCNAINIPYQKLLKLERNIKPIADIRGTAELIGLMKAWKPDIAFLFSAKAGIIGSIAARLSGVKKVVYRIGGWSWLDPVSNRQKMIRMWSERLIAPLKDIIIVQHPGDKKIAEDCGIRPRHSIIIAPNGINIDTFDRTLLPKDQARLKLETLWNQGILPSPIAHRPRACRSDSEGGSLDSPLIVTIANFYATKDLSNFLQAAKLILEKHPETRFMIMGDGGDQRSEIHALRKTLNLESAVSFPGAIDNAQTLLSGADLFILSSAKEGNPWTVHEAMAARLPCIATDVGACAWLLQNNAGWIVPPKNSEALASATIDALEHPEKASQKAKQARINSETLFTERIMWEETFKALEDRR